MDYQDIENLVTCTCCGAVLHNHFIRNNQCPVCKEFFSDQTKGKRWDMTEPYMYEEYDCDGCGETYAKDSLNKINGQYVCDQCARDAEDY